ncbi:MAG: SUMF1/EgtB/PvdO family nonheme iron enzyme [Haliscomenobacter sp.]|uniref:formylglycine-generating enzyme family protein n=1 Tax=Haliscomenobacter sp. TaxID=2717303 RepID=UPI0029B259EC|nr:SUMF1/EgtB/PvdO family nonheme iron enzyme [Haliscomenobacter sp.]MDX2072437.1 SUMF1/EgtB/PvdO family nonheme iron enzyme [Haliscomenobacter sp.]
MYSYAGSSYIDQVAWYRENSGGKTHPVGSKKANELGIYDMSGNVWEWCRDVWHDNYRGAPADGSAWDNDSKDAHRVLRGGSWYLNPNYCRAANRNDNFPTLRSSDYGFRLVRH